jgi:hypothetical protein
MRSTVRSIGAMLAGLTLFGCAATSQNLNSPATASSGPPDPNCLTETGTHIAAGKSNCRAFGRAFTNEDIERTGATSAADALALLDPSITVHR